MSFSFDHRIGPLKNMYFINKLDICILHAYAITALYGYVISQVSVPMHVRIVHALHANMYWQQYSSIVFFKLQTSYYNDRGRVCWSR